MTFRKLAIASVAVTTLVVPLAACGSDSTSGGPGFDGRSMEQQCFQEMTSAQRQQLEQYVAKQGQSTTTSGANTDGTQDVCVLDSGGNARYYNQNDGFGDYLMYSMMMGRSNPLITAGVLSGNLDVGTAMALNLLVGTDHYGNVYHPYSRVGGQWARESVQVKNVHVTNVYYGKNSTPVPYKGSAAKAPSGYTVHSVPKAQDNVVQISKTKTGGVNIAPVKGQSASSKIQDTRPDGSSYSKSKSYPVNNKPNNGGGYKPSNNSYKPAGGGGGFRSGSSGSSGRR